MIVEDDSASMELLKEILSELNISFLCAGSGESAIKIIEENTIDLVLLDLRLLDISGFEVINKIRNRYGQKIKVITQTADTYKKFVFYKYAGSDGYLSKPIIIIDLLELISKSFN